MVNVAWSTGRGQPLSASSTRLQAVSVLPCYCSIFGPIIIWKRKCVKVSPRDEIQQKDQQEENKEMMMTRRCVLPCLEVRLWTLEHLSPAWSSLQNIAPLCQTYPSLHSRSSRGALPGCIFLNACIYASVVKRVALVCATGATCTFVHLADVGSVVGRERKPSQFREGALRRNTSWGARYTLHLQHHLFNWLTLLYAFAES